MVKDQLLIAGVVLTYWGLPMPFGIARIVAPVAQILPGKLLTSDQVCQLRYDAVVSPAAEAAGREAERYYELLRPTATGHGYGTFRVELGDVLLRLGRMPAPGRAGGSQLRDAHGAQRHHLHGALRQPGEHALRLRGLYLHHHAGP